MGDKTSRNGPYKMDTLGVSDENPNESTPAIEPARFDFFKNILHQFNNQFQNYYLARDINSPNYFHQSTNIF